MQFAFNLQSEEGKKQFLHFIENEYEKGTRYEFMHMQFAVATYKRVRQILPKYVNRKTFYNLIGIKKEKATAKKRISRIRTQ